MYNTLRRKTTKPVQMHIELRAKELAWFSFFRKDGMDFMNHHDNIR